MGRENKKPNKRKWTAAEVRQWYRDTGAFTYCNPKDLNLVVKKPNSEGLTVNWANPKAYLLLWAIFAVVLGIVLLVKQKPTNTKGGGAICISAFMHDFALVFLMQKRQKQN